MCFYTHTHRARHKSHAMINTLTVGLSSLSCLRDHQRPNHKISFPLASFPPCWGKLKNRAQKLGNMAKLPQTIFLKTKAPGFSHWYQAKPFLQNVRQIIRLRLKPNKFLLLCNLGLGKQRKVRNEAGSCTHNPWAVEQVGVLLWLTSQLKLKTRLAFPQRVDNRRKECFRPYWVGHKSTVSYPNDVICQCLAHSLSMLSLSL